MPFDISNEQTDEKDKKVVVNHNVKFSFMLTYILLLTTATITFIEAIRTTDPIVRHIFNLETTISIVAGYFYSIFVAKIDEAEKQNKPLDWLDLTKTRYSDWVITTPMMLLALVVVLGYNSKITVKFMTMMSIIILNYFMLYVGYLGETNILTRFYAMVVGFVAFFAMFFIIFMNFVRPKYNFVNNVMFGFYLIVWSLYGVVYMFGEETKNIVMNALDCTAKCLIGLFLWVYYTGIVKW
uniref:Bacteriorhodopsin-like protein n=1 Tax=viral metagenome TaxID=1070528 RepID=A0A6C0LRT2_9ZZZZ